MSSPTRNNTLTLSRGNMTPVALLIGLAGLSHREAAEFLEVRLDTVQSWHRSARPNKASPGVIAELAALIAHQERAADAALQQIAEITESHGPPQAIDLGYPADDHEAQALGFPCVGAWEAMAARVVARSPIRIELVPRGANAATAAAMKGHGL